jgi:hypothetical protein
MNPFIHTTQTRPKSLSPNVKSRNQFNIRKPAAHIEPTKNQKLVYLMDLELKASKSSAKAGPANQISAL